MTKTYSTFLPPNFREALMTIGLWPDELRITRIDDLTAAASIRHPELVRSPGDVSMVPVWDAMRLLPSRWP